MTGGSNHLGICIGAVLTGEGLKAFLGTSCRLCFNALIIVTKSLDLFLLFKCYLTYRALLTVGKTCAKTGCRITCYDFLGMAESLGLITDTCFATSRTGVGCVTAVITIGRGYNCGFLMACSLGLIACIASATVGACVGCVTLGSTSRSCYYHLIVMGNHCKIVVGCIIASGALYVCIPTGRCTCRSLFRVRNFVMSKSIDILGISVAAYSAIEDLRALLFTAGSLCYGFLVAVRNSINGVICTVKLNTADGAVKNLVIASCFAAGCRSRIFDYRRACLTNGKLFTANVTVVRAFSCFTLGELFAANVTVVRAFSCFTLRELFTANVTVVIIVIAVSALACCLAAVLTCVRSLLLCMSTLSHIATVVTNVILGVKVCVTYFSNFFGICMRGIILTCIGLNTLLGASGSCCYSAFIIVTELGNRLLSNDNLATIGALLTFGKTLFGTGGSYGRNANLGVRKLFDLLGVAVAALTGKGLYTCFGAGGSFSDLFGVLMSMFTTTDTEHTGDLINKLTAGNRNYKSTN